MQKGGAWGGLEEHKLVHIPPRVSSATDGFMDGESFLRKSLNSAWLSERMLKEVYDFLANTASVCSSMKRNYSPTLSFQKK